jgi:hypothetical protein
MRLVCEGSARVASWSKRSDSFGRAAWLAVIRIDPFGLPLGEDAAFLFVQAPVQVVHERALRGREQLAVSDIGDMQVRRTHQVGITESVPLQVGGPVEGRWRHPTQLGLGDHAASLITQIERLERISADHSTTRSRGWDLPSSTAGSSSRSRSQSWVLGAGQPADVGVARETDAYRLADRVHGPDVVLVVAAMGGGRVWVARNINGNPKVVVDFG